MRSLAKFLALLLLLIFLAALLFLKDGFYGFFSYLGDRFGLGGSPTADLAARNLELAGENEYLRSLMAEQKIKEDSSDSLRLARIYSRYPFADRSVLIINQGAAGGIREGMPVLAAKGILLGKIIKVKKSFSEVQTIFDPAWRSSVGVGSQKTKALLMGGSAPILDLIEPTAIVNDNDPVINLSPDFPYGLAVGQLINLDKPVAQPWFRGELEPFFDLIALKEVLVDVGFQD